ncbi:hypothetical protein VB735_13870 [Halotia wernerae UHCC 0503]|nr:hypothetical protein [Halotia wernerae UHCC 0503]
MKSFGVRILCSICPLSRDEFETALLGGENQEIIGEIFDTSVNFTLKSLKLLYSSSWEHPSFYSADKDK